MMMSMRKRLVDDDDDVSDKGRGGSLEGVMMMVMREEGQGG